MSATKSERSADKAPTSESAPETTAPTTPDLLTLRDNCVAQLSEIAARAQQLSVQLSADWTREQQETATAMLNRQRSLTSDYMSKAREAAAQSPTADQMSEFSQRCLEDYEVSRREALKTLDNSSDKLRGVYDTGIAEANRDWDAACAGFVAVLQQQLTKNGSTETDPVQLAAIGGYLRWIASMMRKPSPTP